MRKFISNSNICHQRQQFQPLTGCVNVLHCQCLMWTWTWLPSKCTNSMSNSTLNILLLQQSWNLIHLLLTFETSSFSYLCENLEQKLTLLSMECPYHRANGMWERNLQRRGWKWWLHLKKRFFKQNFRSRCLYIPFHFPFSIQYVSSYWTYWTHIPFHSMTLSINLMPWIKSPFFMSQIFGHEEEEFKKSLHQKMKCLNIHTFLIIYVTYNILWHIFLIEINFEGVPLLQRHVSTLYALT